MKNNKLTECSEVQIFVARNSAYSCLPSTMLMVPAKVNILEPH